MLKNQQWEPFADSIVFRLQLARHSQGGFTLLAVDDKAIVVSNIDNNVWHLHSLSVDESQGYVSEIQVSLRYTL